MADFKTTVFNTIGLIQATDIIDVIIVTFIIYYVFKLVKDTSAGQVIKAIVLIIVGSQLTSWFGLHVTNYLFDSVIQIGAIALIVVFQPELRKMLTRLGSSRAKEIFMIDKENGFNRFDTYITTITKAIYDLSSSKTGALLVFERGTNLGEISGTGTLINADVSGELIKNIFYPKAPLHDGAVIIRDYSIHAAGCVLPLSKNNNLSKDLGTRHKAGIGVSEESDAVVVIVSEETGTVSCAIGGMLKRHLAKETLDKLLINELMPKIDEKKHKSFRFRKEKRV